MIISSWEVQKSGSSAEKNLDPTVLPVGMMATADSILCARSSAYAESYNRRAKEGLLGVKEKLTVGVGDKHESK